VVTGRDPQVQAAMDAAARELARRLEPYVPDVSRDRRPPRAALEGDRTDG